VGVWAAGFCLFLRDAHSPHAGTTREVIGRSGVGTLSSACPAGVAVMKVAGRVVGISGRGGRLEYRNKRESSRVETRENGKTPVVV
jgi:hypothetical protein